MKKNLLCLFTFFSLLVTCFGTQAQPCKQVIGYYPNWQWYDRAKLVNPATINYSKYTVINYAFFAPQDNGSILTTDAWADENLLLGQINWSTTPTSYYPNTSIVDRAHNAGVKIVPSIGGWTLSDKFPAIAADATKRANFAHACIQLCQQYNFDGIDIDWEYPGYTEHLGTTADKQNFTIFLQQIRDSLTTYGTAHNKTMLLTACVGASQSNMSNVEWGNIASVLDYINLMSYDFFGSWDATANHNSPLYAPAQGDANFNLNSALQYLLTHYGVPANKINAGTAFYGRSAKTTGTPALFAPISGTDAATFSEDEGSPLYYNIAKRFNLFSQQWDSQAQVPYLLGLNGLNTFVSYDNAQSIALKAQYIVNNNLAGAIIWEITGDYLETAIGSGVIADTPLADTLNYVFCNGLPPITCNTPTALAATPATTSAVLNWASTGAASYQIQYKLATATNWTTTTSTTNSKTISGLTACTNYEYKVSSVCSNTLSSAYSTAFGFQTTGCTPVCNAPTALAATPATTSAVLNWASTAAASYQIQIRPVGSATWTTVTSVTNNYTLSALTACTNYEYKVSSVCSNTLSSAYSTAFGFQTTGCVNTCNAPTALAATPANTSALLNWASTGAASYQIQYKLATATTWTSTTSTTNSKTISGLTACTNYQFRVKSVCSNTLSSANSATFTFQTTGCVSLCNVPTALAATPATTSATLNWASTGAASYQIQYKLATATTWTSYHINH
jgi:chitinase